MKQLTSSHVIKWFNRWNQ